MLLFGVVAVTPAIVVAVFSTVFFDLGFQAMFNEPVRVALQESLDASRGYLEEHRNNIRADALGMANDLTRAGRFLSNDPNAFAAVLAEQTALRGLTEAVIYEPETGMVVASSGIMAGLGVDPPPEWATALARAGDVAVLGWRRLAPACGAVVAPWTATPALVLLIGRPVDPEILDHMARTETGGRGRCPTGSTNNRFGFQVTFALIFALVALLVLARGGADRAGDREPDRAAGIGRLILAAERVRPAGDLGHAGAGSGERRRSGGAVAGLSATA